MDSRAPLPLAVFEDRSLSCSAAGASSLPPDPALLIELPRDAHLLSSQISSHSSQHHRAGQTPEYAGSLIRGNQLWCSQKGSDFTATHREAQRMPSAEHGVPPGSGPGTAVYGPARTCRSRAPPRLPYGRNWWGAPPQPRQQQEPPPYWLPAKGLQGQGFPSGDSQQRHAVGQPPMLLQPAPAAPPVVMAPPRASASSRKPPCAQVALEMPRPAVQSSVELCQPQSHVQQLVQKVAVHAKQKQPVSQQPAPALQRAACTQPLLSQLHHEVAAFAQRASPTQEETDAVKELERIVRGAAAAIWPQSTVGLFGSQCSSMALPGSDVDITILNVGVAAPKKGASGFTLKQRKTVVQELRRLLKALNKLKLVCGKAEVIPARIPIVKCYIKVHGMKIAADISMGVNNGVEAVPFIMQQVQFFGPCLRALTVVMKALLKQQNLNERVSGGLGSYCILNLVMAHLIHKGVRATSTVDLGYLLLTLLEFLGRTMDCSRQAISVRMGGIVEKQQDWKQADRPFLLAIEDPQQPGTDIGSGSFNIQEVRSCVARAHDVLRASCLSTAVGGAVPEAASWAAVQAEGQTFSVPPLHRSEFPLLDTILNTSLALDRSPSASQARMDMASKKSAKVKVKAKKGIKALGWLQRNVAKHPREPASGEKVKPMGKARNQAKKAAQGRKKAAKRKAGKAVEQTDQPKRKRRKVQKQKTVV